MEQKIKFDISLSAILKVILTILLIWLLFVVKEIVVMLFIVLIIVAALTPSVDFLSKYIPRILAVIIMAVLILGLFVGVGFIIVPPLVTEIKLLAINLPILVSRAVPFYYNIQSSIPNYQESLLNFSSQIGHLTSGIFTTTIGLFSGIFAFITILILAFYMLIEKSGTNYLYNLFEESKREKIKDIISKIQEKMGQWLCGQFILMLTVGIFYGIVLSVLGVPYALVLALWGALTEIIPYLGPWLGLIPAVLIAFTVSPWAALFVVIAYFVIQQLESMILVPKIMGKAVGLSPVVVIIAMLAGAKLMGILGVVIAVPVAAVLSVIIQEWSEIRKLHERN